jgi:putative ABC transport system permease protein
MTHADLHRLTGRGAPSYLLNLRLRHPAQADMFVWQHSAAGPTAPALESWLDIRQEDASLVRNERRVLGVGSWLLALLALSSLGVLVGGRISAQLSRIGLLKAVGGTGGFVAAVVMAEYLVLALAAAAIGLAAGWLAAPLLAAPSAGLIGVAGKAQLTVPIVASVVAVPVAVVVSASLVPALRAARISTVLALADAARAPRRPRRLIAISARLPTPLLLGLRIAARRPQRAVLNSVSIAITVTGLVAVLGAHNQLAAKRLDHVSALADPRATRLNHVLLLITLMLVVLAAINLIFVTWATVIEARRVSAIARALGATPQAVSAGLSAAQVLPATVGALLGIPAGAALFAALSPQTTTTLPPLLWLLAIVPATVLATTALTLIPARMGARRPVARVLESEIA